MELTAYEIALIGVGSAIIGSLLTAWLGYRFAIDISNREFIHTKKLTDTNNHRQAVAKLKAAFAPALGVHSLHRSTSPDKTIDTMLRDELPKQDAAIREFRDFVPEGDRAGYDKAWENYKTGPHGPMFGYYMGDENLFKKRINAVLDFAK